ncbi:MAG: hypothetical protein DRO67_05520, partial [Candidatus Asgardarchaeum californiense]
MHINYSIKKSIIVGIIFLSLLLPSNLTIGASVQKDDGDGIYIDTFQDALNVTLTHCIVSGGSILLKNETTSKIYDFANASDAEAYRYTTPIFFAFIPPRIHMGLETQFNTIEYSQIKRIDGDVVTSEATLFKKIVVHHFRFKISQDIESITQLDVSWHGKAENDRETAIYYWQPFGIFGRWQKGETNSSSGVSHGTIMDLNYSRSGDLFISNDNYIDICIVASPEIGKTCSLSTDYIKIVGHGLGYSSSGSAVSTFIDPQNLFLWESFTFEDYKQSGTSVMYHILDDQGDIIDDSILPGNEEGFSSSPVSLVSLPTSINKIKIMANLTSNDPSTTPKIYSWGVLWQTENNVWKDLFNSTLRVDEKENINIVNGNASIIPFYSDWSMFGQNPANTRSSDGTGPDNNNLYWYSLSTNEVGGGQRNPVVKDGKLYIASHDGKKIYIFNSTVEQGNEGSSNPAVDHIDLPSYTIINSPVVTDDYIIVATGNSSNGGEENKVYAFDKTTLVQVWEFEYNNPSDPNICYS